MSKISTCLWFDERAEEAANFYVDTFRACGQEAAIGEVLHYGEGMHKPKGTVLTAEFTLAGQDFFALNGGPQYSFSPAVSMTVNCADQGEVDAFWDRLVEGGKPVQCGWLTDRFGLSWQVTPTELIRMLRDPDPARAHRVMQAMMPMVKLDLGVLKAAYEGKLAA